MRTFPFCGLLAGVTAVACGAAPEGIPRELARERAAQVSALYYHLSFSLSPHPSMAEGHADIRFTLAESWAESRDATRPLLLDFREGAVSRITINGASTPVAAENGHLLLAQSLLRTGSNQVVIDFTAPVAPAGRAITLYKDPEDGSEYVYTLFVPMDASMAFPCFDQPELKGRFQLDVTAPSNWTVISNTAGRSTEASGSRHTTFGETQPISTYLFAFAAGPFRKIHDAPGLPGIYARQSQVKRADAEANELQEVTARGIEYLSAYFAQPFPFPKYDLVLVPEFAYGGMEHAGCTFLREESVLFRRAPTHSDLIGRDILTLHELTHQWFGDFTTMRWFDDLWLKEGFAQYMAYQALSELKPDEGAWKRFYDQIKPLAYAIDSTKGTTPIFQEIPNLKDAKSAYGAIVYQKAPSVLKQLSYVLGAEHFRDALRLYLKEHAYGNAEWSDLVHAGERVSGQSLKGWADTWIHRRGMPQVNVDWSCDKDRLTRLSLTQRDVLGEGGVWPLSTQVGLHYLDGKSVSLRVDLKTKSATVGEAAGKVCPAYVFANEEDYGYGRFLLDARSSRAVLTYLGSVKDLFEQTLLWGSLWDSVRVAELAPGDFVSLAARLLPAQADEPLTQRISSRVISALHYYAGPELRRRFVPQIEELAANRMLHAEDRNLRIIWFRAYTGIAETGSGRARLKSLLDGSLTIPGVQLQPLDRWGIVTSLIAQNDPDANQILQTEQQQDRSGDTEKYAYVAEAARPDPAVKRRYFDDYMHNEKRSEDWIAASLGAFNRWNQAELTFPYLGPALAALPSIKQNRKIFFLVDWLDAFVGGQQSADAQAKVLEFLKTPGIDRDLRLKILQADDDLERTVKIRSRFPE